MYRLTLRIREQARSHIGFCNVAYDAISWRQTVEAQASKGLPHCTAGAGGGCAGAVVEVVVRLI